MKKYLTNILFVIVTSLILAFGLDMFMSLRLMKNKNRVFANWNQIYNDTNTYNLLINGSSRAWVQYNPFILDSILHINTYNLGIDGSSINRQIIKFNTYCDMHNYPTYLIQNIDLGTMAIEYGYEREQFFPYFFIDRKLMNEVDKYEKFSYAEKYIPCYRYLGYEDVIIEALFNDNRNHYFEFINKGYMGHDKVWDGNVLSTMDSVECACDTNAIILFVNFLSDVIDNGTQVIFVYAPVYHEVTNKMKNKKNMYEMYDTIAQRFNIPILDYNDISMCYDTTYFYNGTHLNRIGAELFTTQLAKDIDSLGLLK